MKQYHVAILGATGAVGMQMLEVLLERNFRSQVCIYWQASAVQERSSQ